MIVHINGWPGVGKSTVGRMVADKIGARFIHNHVLHDVSFACAGRDDDDRWPLYERVRSAAYDVLERRPKGEIFVMTNALCKTDDREIEAWNHVVKLAIRRGVPLVPVILTAPLEEIARRMSNPKRSETKLKSPSALTNMMDNHHLQIPRVDQTLVLEVGTLSAEESAEAIASYLSAHSQPWTSATDDYFDLN